MSGKIFSWRILKSAWVNPRKSLLIGELSSTHQSSFEAMNVASSQGSGILSRSSRDENASKWANSLRRWRLRPSNRQKKEGRLSRRFLAHEEHRNMQVQNEQDHGLLQFLVANQLRQTLPEHAIADLVVVLRKKDRGFRR